MSTFLFRRVLQTIPVLLGVALISFVLSELSGNAVRGLLGQSASPETLARLKELYGYDQPRYVRLGAYMLRLARGDLGTSIFHQGQPVTEMIAAGMGVTFKLALGAMLLAALLGVCLGILSAWRPYSFVDYAASVFAAIGISVPAFFLGMLLLLLFSVKLGVFPVGGYEGGRIAYLILPCMTLGLLSTASIARLTRNCMLDTLGQDYVRSGRAKGLRNWRVLVSHALPNALVPVVTIIGSDFGGLLGGAVLTETVYGLPGMGQVLSLAIFNRDLPVVMGCCVVFALIFVTVNLLVDVSYAFLDPRIRHAE